jgi:pimeloyl-ACP methyl ester carboxylesterase
MAGMPPSSDPVPARPATDLPRLHHVEHGDGAPVLVLHGAYSTLDEPVGFLEPYFATRPGHRRIYVDLPGMGDSPAGGVAGPEDALAAIEAVVDELVGDAPLLVVAQSYGAYLARGLASRRPDQVAGLAMLCPLLVSGMAAGEHVPVQVDDDLGVELTPDQDAEYRAYFVVQTAETARRFLDAVAPALGRFDGPAVERLMGGRLDPDPDGGDVAYPGPTLIVTGRQDSLVGYVDQWELRTRHPHATFVALDMAGHALPHERPTVLAALLDDWLDRVALAARA